MPYINSKMKNGEKRKASVSPSRVFARKYARLSFALMSVARATTPTACGRARARKTRPERRDRERQMERKGPSGGKERVRKRTPMSGPACAHADDENGSCSWALPRALRRLGSLRTPFYRSASTALVPVPWSPLPPPLVSPRVIPPTSYTLFLSLSLCRTDPNITVLFRLLSISLSFFLAISRAPCRRPSSCTVTRTHTEAESCAKEDHRTRHLQLGRLPTFLRRPPSTPCLTS